MVRKNRSRLETIKLVYDVVAASDEPMSRREIADAIGRKVTPYLIEIINHFVEVGQFEEAYEIWRSNSIVYIYTLRGKMPDNARRLAERPNAVGSDAE